VTPFLGAMVPAEAPAPDRARLGRGIFEHRQESEHGSRGDARATPGRVVEVEAAAMNDLDAGSGHGAAGREASVEVEAAAMLPMPAAGAGIEAAGLEGSVVDFSRARLEAGLQGRP